MDEPVVLTPGAAAKSPIRRSEFFTPGDDPELVLALPLALVVAVFGAGAPAWLFSKKDKSLSDKPVIICEYRCMQKKTKLLNGWK
jgi:hypothetical protein